MTQDWIDLLAIADRQITAAFPNQFDMSGIDEAGLDAVQQSTRAAWQGVQSVSWFVGEPQPDQQVISNIFLTCQVEDAAAYLQSLKRSFELENRVTALPGAELPFQWQFKEFSTAGRDGFAWGFDIAEIAADPNVPQWDGILRKFCGDDGEFWIYAVAIDPHRVLISVESLELLPQQIARTERGETGLVRDPGNHAALQLLDPDASCKCLVSPQGCLGLVERALGVFFAQLGGIAMTPDFPQISRCPPLAFSSHAEAGQLQFEAVAPRESLQALGQWVKSLRNQP